MNYYFDTEFIEGTQNNTFLCFNIGQTKPTIDLISIGIVCEDKREYYAISKEFNIKEAWNRFQLKETSPVKKSIGIFEEKEYWIRENVLKPIFVEWRENINSKIVRLGLPIPLNTLEFNYKNFKHCIKSIGKNNAEIAKEIKEFTTWSKNDIGKRLILSYPVFYGYYADYDWVVFCWLFGKMNNLPNGFPKYCIDLKQEFNRIENLYKWVRNSDYRIRILEKAGKTITSIKELRNYPKQTNEHNALADAKWNFELYKFLQKL
jgi:hypothetical protein